jgi:ABC-type sugar transport system substrate-binding protein
LSVFENILQAEPEIDGVFAHNDEMILGAIEAAKAAGRDAEIVFVGFDAVDDAVAAVDAGDLAATIAQQPAVMGQLGVDTAAAYLGGASVEAFTPVNLALVAGDMEAVGPMGDYVLGLSLSTLNNPFFVTLGDGAQAAADAAGAELIIVDAQDDPAQEATNNGQSHRRRCYRTFHPEGQRGWHPCLHYRPWLFRRRRGGPYRF